MICKNNKAYEVTHRVPFIVSRQRLNKNSIKLNEEIIQLKVELHKRSIEYLKTENHNVESKAINDVLSNVIGKYYEKNRRILFINKILLFLGYVTNN